MGYTNVYVYLQGLPGWAKMGYPLESTEKYPAIEPKKISGPELRKMLNSAQGPVVLDIRDETDRKATGQIKDSLCICLDDLIKRIGEVPKDRDIVVVDLHGKQAKIAARYLASKGTSNVYVLNEGFVKEWKRYGYPVKK
jgi:rhodanese-related sulfurtransferase